MGKIIQFDDFYNRNIYENYEVVDKINIDDYEKISKHSDLDFVQAIGNVVNEWDDLAYYPTYCFLVQNRTITVYYDEECPENEKEPNKYDRNMFIQALEREFTDPMYNED